jgi:transcriptional regulator with XRE-family HTH domain
MPSAAPPVAPADRTRLLRLGSRLREARRDQGVTATAAADAAGMSRVTWHRIEMGEPSVAMGAWVAAAHALGLTLDLVDPAAAQGEPAVPARIALAEYPQLRKLAWQLQGVEALAPREALDLYERNWRHVDKARLTKREAALVKALSAAFSGGRLLV